jgi:hypothetical protein
MQFPPVQLLSFVQSVEFMQPQYMKPKSSRHLGPYMHPLVQSVQMGPMVAQA